MDGADTDREVSRRSQLIRRLLILAVMICSVRVQADGQDGRLTPAAADASSLRILKVRGNISVIQGAGANITVLAFPEGITLVDSGSAPMADKVLAAIRTLSSQPIRYIINTSVTADHVGGNEKLAGTGSQITGGNVSGQVGTDGAEIIAHERVLERMIARTVQPPVPIRATPQTTTATAFRCFTCPRRTLTATVSCTSVTTT